jgi:LPXTG-motif cell wall-anchored protein
MKKLMLLLAVCAFLMTPALVGAQATPTDDEPMATETTEPMATETEMAEATATEAMAEATATEAMAEATATTATQPEALPKTGGDSTMPLLMALAGLAVFGGLMLRRGQSA